jgi:hypothetical protein
MLWSGQECQQEAAKEDGPASRPFRGTQIGSASTWQLPHITIDGSVGAEPSLSGSEIHRRRPNHDDAFRSRTAPSPALER